MKKRKQEIEPTELHQINKEKPHIGKPEPDTKTTIHSTYNNYKSSVYSYI